MTRSSFDRLSWQPLQPFGAEVDVDLRESLTEGERQRLKDLFFRHEVLVFRQQQLTHPQQIDVMEYIAPVLRTPEFVHYISTDKSKGVLGSKRLPYHSDLSYAKHLLLGISLHAVDVVDGQTSTRFVSSTRPIEKLPPVLRKRLEGLHALHVFPWAGYGSGHLEADPPKWAPRQSHPVILPHPVTGVPVLYIDEMLTARIEGLPHDESRALIEELQGYLYAADNQLKHIWHNGDIVIWDNVAVQHARSDLSGNPGPRTLQKVKLGDIPFEQQWPSSPEMLAAIKATADAGL